MIASGALPDLKHVIVAPPLSALKMQDAATSRGHSECRWHGRRLWYRVLQRHIESRHGMAWHGIAQHAYGT